MATAVNQILMFKLFDLSAHPSQIFSEITLSCGRNTFNFGLIYTELCSSILNFFNTIWVETLSAALPVLFKLSLESWRVFRISCPFSACWKQMLPSECLCREEASHMRPLSEQLTTEHSARAEQSLSQN